MAEQVSLFEATDEEAIPQEYKHLTGEDLAEALE